MAADTRVGTEFAGYRIESVLGRGGMGVVYLAEDARLGRKVALKLLSSELSADQRFRDRFIKESRMAAGLEHPNIVPVYEAGEHDGQLYIAMRHIPGSDLGALIEQEGPLPPTRVAAIVEQVADALDTAHERGLIHRDVKPANILVEPGRRDRAYLSDFGVTKRTGSRSELTRTGQFMGTVDYVAPEQIEGKEVDGRADQYSLGCVAFECLAGRPPFAMDSEVATIYAHLQQPAPRLSSVQPALPGALDAAVATAMAKSPGDRYPTCGSLAEALRVAAEPLAEPVAEAPRSGRGPRRTLPLVVAGIVVLAAVVAGILFVSGRNPTEPNRPTGRSSAGATQAPRLTRIDPSTNRIAKAFDLNATSVAIGDDAVWTLLPADVIKVNPETNSIVADIPIQARAGGQFLISPASLAVGEGAVWVSAAPSLVRIDPGRNVVAAELPSAIVSCPGCPAGRTDPSGVGAGLGSVWVLNPSAGVVAKVDPITNSTEATIRIQNPTSVAVGEGAVWVTNGITDVVYRIDPKKAKIVKRIPLPGAANGVAVGGGSVWVSNSTAGTVVRIDPAANVGVATISVGKGPKGLAFGAGAVWVANSVDGTISRIDPVTDQVVGTIQIGLCGQGGPAGVAADDHGIWVVSKCR
jgi:YVTN family beta-propeller protein